MQVMEKPQNIVRTMAHFGGRDGKRS